jgi:hypothetical protein
MIAKMLRLFVFLSLLFISLPVKAATAAVQGSGIKVDPYTWDMGQVKKGEVIERVFNLKNESDRVWNITGINNTCSCTGSDIKDKTISAGKSTEVKVKFNSRGYSPGPVQQYIYISTDDPSHPVLKFTLKIEVIE